tara:strand:+ start:885 stop:1781 length:897 start_codon:yes stop_codon:yes gene_type:complete
MEIIIHNPSHSGDILHTLEFVKIFIKSNPNCKFTLVPASCKCLYENLISYNVKIIQHNCIWNSILKKNELIKTDIITKLHNVLTHYESDILYINIWKMLVQDNTNCINLIGRKDFIKNFVNKTNSLYNLNIQFNCNSDIELIPILPDINIDKVENYLKSFNKKFIFFYNLNSTCGIESEYRVNINDEVINNLLSEIDNDTILLVTKKTEIQNSKIINLESDLNIQMSNDGKNLLVYEKISRMCDKIYFKINGGSLFILNGKNIENEQNFNLIKSSNINTWYNILKNSYHLKDLNIYNI